MGHIFDLYRNKNAVVVYFSDHGEEIYDYRDQRGRHVSYAPSADMLRHQNEVPFVIWCSDRYKQLHPRNRERYSCGGESQIHDRQCGANAPASRQNQHRILPCGARCDLATLHHTPTHPLRPCGLRCRDGRLKAPLIGAEYLFLCLVCYTADFVEDSEDFFGELGNLHYF